jgi:hypothetical protein
MRRWLGCAVLAVIGLGTSAHASQVVAPPETKEVGAPAEERRLPEDVAAWNAFTRLQAELAAEREEAAAWNREHGMKFRVDVGRLPDGWPSHATPARLSKTRVFVDRAAAFVLFVGVSIAAAGLLMTFFRPRRLTWRGGPRLTRAQARWILQR